MKWEELATHLLINWAKSLLKKVGEHPKQKFIPLKFIHTLIMDLTIAPNKNYNLPIH